MLLFIYYKLEIIKLHILNLWKRIKNEMDKRKKVVVLAIGISIILIFGIIYKLVQNGIELNKLNNVYKDIDIIEERVTIYYLNNGSIPIKDNSIRFNYSVNPNDNDKFYEIDLEKLENLSINYGKREYGDDDIYIINEQSHTVYYLKGINYNKEKFYARTLKYKKVNLNQYK